MKEFEFTESLQNYWSTGFNLPFGMEITIRKIKNSYLWDFGNGYQTLKTGKSTTLEGAKKNSQKAFKNHLAEELKKCEIGEKR